MRVGRQGKVFFLEIFFISILWTLRNFKNFQFLFKRQVLTISVSHFGQTVYLTFGKGFKLYQKKFLKICIKMCINQHNSAKICINLHKNKNMTQGRWILQGRQGYRNLRFFFQALCYVASFVNSEHFCASYGANHLCCAT